MLSFSFPFFFVLVLLLLLGDEQIGQEVEIKVWVLY